MRSEENNRKNRIVFIISIICVIIGLAIRLLFCISYPVQPRDSYTYKSTILKWEESGKIPENARTHQFSLLILKSPYHYKGYNIIKGGIAINMVIGISLILLIVRISSSLFDIDNLYVVFLTGLTAATLPMLVRYSCTLLRENIYLLFSFLTLFLFVKYFKKERFFYLVIAGLFSAFAFLCRQEGLEIIVIVAIIFSLRFFCGKASFLRGSTHFFVFLISFVASVFLICYLLDFDVIRYADLVAKLEFDPLEEL